jgi:hypothetical protein
MGFWQSVKGLFGSKERAPSKKQVDVDVRFEDSPSGFWSRTASGISGLSVAVSDDQVKKVIKDNLKMIFDDVLNGYLAVQFPQEKVSVIVLVKRVENPLAVISYLKGTHSETMMPIHYLPKDSREGSAVIVFDSTFICVLFGGANADNPFFDEIKTHLIHEMLHHYDNFVNEHHEKMVKRLMAISKAGSRDELMQELSQNPSYLIRNFFIFSRMESITTLHEGLILLKGGRNSERAVLNPVSGGLIRSYLFEVARGNTRGAFVDFLANMRYPAGMTMAFTILLASIDDDILIPWRADILKFLRKGNTLGDMPKIDFSKKKVDEVTSLIRGCGYRDYVRLYEMSAKRLGLDEKEMIITTAQLKELVVLSAQTNRRMVEEELRKKAA